MERQAAFVSLPRLARALPALLLASGCIDGDGGQPDQANATAGASSEPSRHPADVGSMLELDFAEPGTCTPYPSDCGGDPTGSWTLAEGCLKDVDPYADSQCLDFQTRRVRASGGIYVRSDFSVESTVVLAITDEIILAPDCSGTCRDNTFTDVASTYCQRDSTNDDTCTCTLAERGLTDDFFTQGVESSLRDDEYCIEDDKLILEDGDEGNTIVFQRVPQTSPGPDPSLIGATVQYSSHCCSGEPSDLNRTSQQLIAEVTSAIEFPAKGDYALAGHSLVPGTVDIDAQSIVATFEADSDLLAGDFNGTKLVFQGGNFSRIIRAEVAPDSDAPGLQPELEFSDRSLTFSIAGGTVVRGDALVIALELE